MNSAYTRVILHCSATPDYLEGEEHFDRYGVAEIDKWHKARGWSGCGYHFVIRRPGDIESGRSVSRIGAHTLGENYDSIGICWIGTNRPTHYQVDSLRKMYRRIRTSFGIEHDQWFGHYEYTNNKTCPGVSMELVRAFLKRI